MPTGQYFQEVFSQLLRQSYHNGKVLNNINQSHYSIGIIFNIYFP
ncbi:hypothetical protein J2Y45_003255 [Dyadobacter sp. BE34]|uniref:Uncharacterized protein n=1 Tax=Dyadobacter fermentans TaxID=94254 RepID=A0ABU1QY91_9BACT|nr:hypothetical protein [Dyadobacter fermentans]MDR7043804.1 hypothetical protein [Dyadobacter sp. BE242]MDR7198115.1 hypothetical protein [Dyadobacter sp. BE34]MDR7216078.1 hypothetical protein [Dyadobacter sp. BE31]MDR7264396.1 hypothetical protein [Dyadobacter sp. BE32]